MKEIKLKIKYIKEFDSWGLIGSSKIDGTAYLARFDTRTNAHMAATAIERLAIDSKLFAVSISEEE